MINITPKFESLRVARATASITMAPDTMRRLRENDLPKKDPLVIAKMAAIMAAKKTPDFIPYCHPLLLEGVEVEYLFSDTTVTVEVSVQTLGKTGVEMEALTAASVAALTLYDMLKPVDKDLGISGIRLLDKKGGKTDFHETLSSDFSAAVLVTSDGTYAGKREDKSGKIIQAALEGLGIGRIRYVVLPDEEERIRDTIRSFCTEGIDLVLTTGGTGLGPRDVTVEATRPLIERETPAIMQAIRAYGQRRTPYAMLSRGLAGVCGKTLIINLPGSSRGVKESLEAIFPPVLHLYNMMRGGGHE